MMTLAQLRAELLERRPHQPAFVDYLLSCYVVDPARVEEHKALHTELCPDWKPWTYAWFIHNNRQLVLSEEVTA